MKPSIIHAKSTAFSEEAAIICFQLKQDQHIRTLSLQLLRSATSVGAMVKESKYAESKKDFLHKMKIALKECNESMQWISLLHSVKAIDEKTFIKLISDATDIRNILVAIVKTSLKNMNESKKTPNS